MANQTRHTLHAALQYEHPLQMVGTVNAYVALMAKEIGYRAIYLSGAGVANSSYALPDLGMTTLHDVLIDVCRITSAVDLPLLVDIDTGWGHPLMIERAVRAIENANAAGVHIEDQLMEKKRCGHRPGKEVVSINEMNDRIQAATEARKDSSFVIMARSDSLASEGLEGLIKRVCAYKEAGADMLFLEAMTSLEEFKTVKEAVGIPILANITEFGYTPLFTTEELASVGVDIALYPLTITRTMNFAARNALQALRETGSQRDFLGQMQTRDELYKFLNYLSYESKF